MNVDGLIDGELPEQVDIEYKHPDEDKNDIVKELSSLANSGGGLLVIGVVEANGKIQSLVPVENPGRFEENLQQAVRSKITPKLPLNHDVNEYHGEWEEYHGTRLVTFSVDPANRLYAYQIDGNRYVFPTRLGSITHYMDGQEVADFYEKGVYPGRGPDDNQHRKTRDKSAGKAFAEVLRDLIEARSEPTASSEPPAGQSSDTEDGDEPPSFETSKPPYFFTPSGDYTAVTFYNMVGPYQPHGFEGYSTHVDSTEVAEILVALRDHLGADISSGAFTITQRNGAWFGYGAGNFVDALTQSERYNSVPHDYDLDTHHSEGTIFITRMREGHVVIRARDGVGSENVEEFSVSFLTDGVPIDNRDLISFLEATGLELNNGHQIDIQSESYHPGSDRLNLRPVERIESDRWDGWVSKIICENPFHDNPDLLEPLLADQGWDQYEPFTSYEYVMCRLANHHPMGEAREYHLRRVNLQELTSVQGTIPHQNAYLLADW